MIVVEATGLTDVGKKRKGNEDAFYMDEKDQLYIVADGMGGHQAGEVASDLVIRTMRDYMERFKNGEDVEELIPPDKSLSLEANRLNSSVHLANRVVFQVSKSKDSYYGMGSTVSGVLFTDDTFIAINVGDSPIYLVRNNSIKLLSVTHTVIAEQMAINPEGAMQLGKSYRHMLTRAMGIEKNVAPAICEERCLKNDIIVISSDGLSDKVNPEEILSVVKNGSTEKTTRELVDMANDRGGDDNITIIVLKVLSVKQKRSGILGWISRFFQ